MKSENGIISRDIRMADDLDGYLAGIETKFQTQFPHVLVKTNECLELT